MADQKLLTEERFVELLATFRLDLNNTFATKDALKTFATKDDLKGLATKQDVEQLATKEEMAAMGASIADSVIEILDKHFTTKDEHNQLKSRMDSIASGY